MIKIKTLVLSTLLLLCCFGVKANEEKTEETNERIKTSIRLLCFGNSFSMDMLGYVPFVMKNIAPDLELTVTIAYNGGSTLAQHMANFSNGDVVQNGVTYSPKKYKYYTCKNARPWTLIGSFDANEVLQKEDWDIITFQQSSGVVRKSYDTYYKPFINHLCDSVTNRLGDSVNLGWVSIHSCNYYTYDELMSVWEDITANTVTLLENCSIPTLFPYGTALQNLRTVRECDTLGYKGFLMADTGHLQEGIGCLCAAYANCLVILKAAGYTNIGVIGDTTRIDMDFLQDNQIQGVNIGNGIIGMQDDFVYKAQVAATKAIENPFEITDISGYNLKEQTFTIRYLIDGEVYKEVLAISGSYIKPLPPPAKEGYEFCHWKGLPEQMPAEDITVYAVFKPTTEIEIIENDNLPDVIYDLNGTRTRSTKRGINIINGNKVLIK